MHTKNVSSAATNNAQTISKTGCAVAAVQCYNAGGAAAYLKLYNTAVPPTVGTDVPLMVFAIPTVSNGSGYSGGKPIQFPAGLSMAIVTGAADTDNTAVAAAQVKVSIVYG